ncbi:unnamed protein product [Rotaria sordida]|uniref:Uncharacterized protein n=1 Tax=Rotaria sordida TaxID=392033 RepID=A0A815Q6D1_9BILA|nr:unnamed protein product [Rotaria sordida]
MATGTPTTNSHSGKHRLEPEIEKYLQKFQVLFLKYVKFLEGEAQLEYYLQQYPLTDYRGSIRSFESQCLLAKLYYAQSRYDECLTYVNLAINSIPNDINQQPNRSSLSLTEIYALNGL